MGPDIRAVFIFLQCGFLHVKISIKSLCAGGGNVTFGVYRFRALILMVVRLCVLLIDVSL